MFITIFSIINLFCAPFFMYYTVKRLTEIRDILKKENTDKE